MSNIEKTYQDLKQMPPHLQNEVVDFIAFIKQKNIIDTQASSEKKPVFGCAKGEIKISEDFDAPLEMFSDYMPK